MSFQELKQRHRQERDAQHSNLRLRVHRALSWLDRAEQADDLDGRFIFLWIAFNAAYATEIDASMRLSEQEIATRMGVSRQPVREALIALEIDNTVEIRMGSGVYVSAEALQTTHHTKSLGDSPSELMQARATILAAVAQAGAGTQPRAYPRHQLADFSD